MLYIRSPTIYSLYIPIICGFISISELAFSLPVPTINFEDHTLHLASRLSSMERDAHRQPWWMEGKNDSPVEKTYGKQKKVTTTTELPDWFFFETFFQCSFFWGWRIFESIKWYLVSVFLHSRIQRWLFRSLVYSDDVRHNWRPYNPWSRNTRSRFLLDHGREVQMVGDGNPWKFMISFLWMRKIWSFSLNVLMLKPLVFWRLFF